MRSLFGDDEEPRAVVKVAPVPVYVPPAEPAEFTLEDRLKELHDAVDVVVTYAITHPKERAKAINKATELLERLVNTKKKRPLKKD